MSQPSESAKICDTFGLMTPVLTCRDGTCRLLNRDGFTAGRCRCLNWVRGSEVVARGVDGMCPISLYPGQAKIGDAVAVRIAQHHSKSGVRTRIVEIESTDQAPYPDVCRQFRDATNVTPNGLGFTSGDIFIPPHMITAEGIKAGDLVEGIALASFDKKRGKWGMKAIQAKSIARNNFDFGNKEDE